ncbi:type II and III secretion system protein family protein [Mesorhizobium sp. B2-4-14]|uniref:type II and III secretion system protein family protein n=1 Tax=Mesorhizobium sp. B2-4-14 TaxID=2589935 RepID=UPI001FEF3C88|nr:type II and III secretion system protein family protein [Mesorhizobium sp. B2-4-14]
MRHGQPRTHPTHQVTLVSGKTGHLGCAIFALIVMGGTGAATSPASASDSQTKVDIAATSQRVKLGLNKSVVIDLPQDAYDILVANPAVADAVTRTARRIYLFGKQVGQTNIFVFDKDGKPLASLDLQVERDVTGLEDYLRRLVPGSDIKVELLNDNVILTGSVETPIDAKRAVELASALVAGGEATTGQYSQTAAGGSASSGVAINNPDSARQKSTIINLLKIVGEDQVTLKVTVAEVSRSVMKQLSMNLVASGSSNGVSWSALSQTVTGLGKQISDSGLSVASSVGSTSIEAYLNAMEEAGVMKTLAEPTLTAVSGEKATFKVGGNYNMVTGVSSATSDDNQTGKLQYSINQIEYGIGLEFQPVVLSAGRISLKIRTSVSEPTVSGSVTQSSSSSTPATNILSLRQRLADTTVELPSGGSMMIAGLVQDNVRQAASGLPGLSKIPVLGTLFRSRDFVRDESELVIIVTPYLVRPTARNELAKPDDNFNPAGDKAANFLGRVNRIYNGSLPAQVPQGQYYGSVGYIYK